MEDKIHIGEKISQRLKQMNMTRQGLGRAIGLSGSNATYLTTRQTIDVETLWKIGKVLRYNFFKLYVVEEGGIAEGGAGMTGERDGKIAALEKELEAGSMDLARQKQENGYLKEINELLRKTGTSRE